MERNYILPTAEYAVPIKSPRDFIRWLSIGAGLYLLDCFVATLEHEAPDVPWIARGVRAAYLFFGTWGWLLAPLISAVNVFARKTQAEDLCRTIMTRSLPRGPAGLSGSMTPTQG
jgi:hypothetical protein